MLEASSYLPLFWHAVTRLGEAQILLPAALLAAAWLSWRVRAGQAALMWMVLLSAAAGLTTATKVAFIGWGLGSASWDFTGISGHAMFAAAVHPLLLRVMATNAAPRTQSLAIATGFALALLVAQSRLEVHAHSVSEVVTGFGLGAAVSLAVLGWQHIPKMHAPPWVPLLLLAWLMALPAGAPPSRTHDMVTRLSLKLSGRHQAFTRHDLHKPPLPPALPRQPLVLALKSTGT
nr:phosphatase PAP2 family protein [uncultured Roseateles sp.]